MEFSTEELDFFSDIFTEKSADCLVEDSRHQLSVQVKLPPSLKSILADSKLTMLAEISHYQLWFPIALSINPQGDFLPQLGTPEIIDIKGNERSWRVDTPKNVALMDVLHEQEIEVLSLSSTGLTLKVPSFEGCYRDFCESSLEMSLAGEKPLKLELDLVRQDHNIVAAKFKDLQHGQESLRKFLFNSHKIKYSSLYQTVAS
jgi:hypothetical protein